MNGLILVDKPADLTSHDVVNRWRRLANTKRVGHLGTLDPMATGLLMLVTGTATRLAQYFGDHDKTYEAEIAFGVVSDTYDARGEVIQTGAPLPSDLPVLREALRAFEGKFLQTPPAVSAKKIGGVAAYKLTRKHIAVELEPVEVDVKKIEVKEFTPGRLQIVVTCSAGTYIRSLAHDLGQKLGCGALLSRLRRIQSGEFTIAQARTLEELSVMSAEGRLCEAVTPAADLLSQLPAEHFDMRVETQIRQGRDFRTSPFVVPPGTPRIKALSRSGELIAIADLRMPNLYHPTTVL